MVSKRKASASRRNGLLGGRPSSGLADVRTLRRRIRDFVRVRGGSMRDYTILVSDALAWRSELMCMPDPVSRVFAHPRTSTTETWRKLLIAENLLL